jgi:short-subunit dehydrogenase
MAPFGRRRRRRDPVPGGAPRGRLALITGASAGIGEGFARALARRGYDLVLVARRRARLEALAAELAGEAKAAVLVGDLTSEAGVAAVEERLRAGDVDLLVNSAGSGASGEFWRLPIARELETLDLNVRALVRLAHAALGPMIARRSGAIVNVASLAAYQPIPHFATYAATKAFVLHFSEALHEEARPHGVTVTAVCPGPVRTEMPEHAGFDEARVPPIAWVATDRVVEDALRAVASRRAVSVSGVVQRAGAWAARVAPRLVARRVAGALIRSAARR